MRKEGGKEGRAKVAVAARRLLNLSREVDGIEGAEQTRATIEKYCEKFEKDMLRLFDRYYRKGDPKAMAVRPLPLTEHAGRSQKFHGSIAQRRCKTSTVASRAFRSTSTSTTSSSPRTESKTPRADSSLARCASEFSYSAGAHER